MIHRQITTLFYPVIMALLLFSPNNLPAQNTSFSEISAPEVKEMLDREQPVIINVLSALEFELQHIPGSINIPINTLKQSTLLPADKEHPLIVYCMNEK